VRLSKTKNALVSSLQQDPLLLKRVERLMSIPAIGPISALTWALEVGEVQRFSSIKKAISYCGLCGDEQRSANSVQRTPISKQRNKHLQTVLIEAAKMAPRYSPKCGDCGKPLTASYSSNHTGRKYAHRSCQNRKCSNQVNESREIIETGFMKLLDELRPRPEFIGLFKEIVSNVWQEREQEASAQCAVFDRQVKDLESRKERLFELFYGKRSTWTNSQNERMR
jgi:hypothetical protein